MPRSQVIETCAYGLVVILCLVALLLVLVSPSGIVNASVVYQGF